MLTLMRKKQLTRGILLMQREPRRSGGSDGPCGELGSDVQPYVYGADGRVDLQCVVVVYADG